MFCISALGPRSQSCPELRMSTQKGPIYANRRWLPCVNNILLTLPHVTLKDKGAHCGAD
jgi:hypothetical protein